MDADLPLTLGPVAGPLVEVLDLVWPYSNLIQTMHIFYQNKLTVSTSKL